MNQIRRLMNRRAGKVIGAVAATVLTATALMVTSQSWAAETLLSQGKPATASSVESATLGPEKAFDGNGTTRWASAEGIDPQWISVDLGTAAAITRVKLTWEAAYGKAYQVQTSPDAATWTTIFSTTTGNGATDDLTGLTGTGRHVRVNGTQRGTTYGYSLFAVEVYGEGSAPPPPPPPPGGLLSQGKPATASSVEDATFGPEKAFDGNGTTRWASAEGIDPQWISVDLGTAAAITRVKLTWEAAYGKAYQVQTSPDAATWTTIFSTTTGNGATDDLTGLTGTGRHVRVNGTQRGTTYGYSLFAVEVYGTIGTPSPTPTTSPTASPTTPPTSPPPGGTPVSINGQLHVCGVQLCNQYNRPIQLRGMSTHGIQWYPQCVNNASLDALANDWKADVLRISMYIQEDGYESDPAGFTQKMHNFIEMATARGMYAIVDWHQLTPGDPNYNLARAKTFFTEIAQRHANKVNILYEVANEPNGVAWGPIKSYAEQIIPVIRAQDSNGVVLVGTRAWSSLGVSDGASETEVINNPVNATNIMYTFHFYAASHDSEYLNTLSRAANSIPMFVTEFGTQNSAGEGANNFAMSQQYIDLMAAKKISWTNWNYSDDNRSGAVFNVGTCPGGPFAGTSSLKQAGVWIRDRIKTPDNFPTN